MDHGKVLRIAQHAFISNNWYDAIISRLGPKCTKVLIYQKHTQAHVMGPKRIPKSHSLTFLTHPTPCKTGRMPEVGQMHLEVPWESLFGPKMKIYVEIPHSEQFWFYEKNFGHIWFFWLCLVKIAHFWTILTKTCFCSNDQYIWCRNAVRIYFMDQICPPMRAN